MLFEGVIIASTQKSILFHGNYWEEPDWLPKSQIDILFENDTVEVRVLTSSWIATQKQLKEFSYRPVQQQEDKNGN